MYHGAGRPSPGPRWEALKEPTDSSGAEEEMDNGASTFTAGALGKRKETGWPESAKAKRARHHDEESNKPRSSGSVSAPGPSQSRHSNPKYISNTNKPGSSRPPHGLPSSSVSTSSVSGPNVKSMGPPPIPSRIAKSTEGESSSSTVTDNSRNKPVVAASSSLVDNDFPSSLTKDIFDRSRQQRSTGSNDTTATTGPRVYDGKPPRLARKSTGKRPLKILKPVQTEPEVIEISSDDESEDEPPPQKQEPVVKSNLPKPPLRPPRALPPLPAIKSVPKSSSAVDAPKQASISNRSSPESFSSNKDTASKSASRSSQASTSKGKKHSSKQQIATKSSGKRRERRPSTSNEESNSAASRTHSRVTSLSSADMRTLDEALGIAHLSNKQDTPIKNTSTTTQIKTQAPSPQIPQSSKGSLDKPTSSRTGVRKSSGDRQNLQTLGDAIVAAAKSNFRLDKRIGDSLANAIDLTSDTEELPPVPTSPNRKKLDSTKTSSSAPISPGKPSIKDRDSTSPKAGIHSDHNPSSSVESNKEASPPPISSSPPAFSLSNDNGLSSNVSDSESTRPSLSKRHSAPSTSPAKPSNTEPTMRSISTGLMARSAEKEVISDHPITKLHSSKDDSLASSLPVSPGILPTAISSTTSLNAVSGVVTNQVMPEARSTSEPSSDGDMGIELPAQSLSYGNYSEEEAMQVLDTIMDEASDDIGDPVLQTSSDDARLSLKTDDRPLSRISSYSSNSDGLGLHNNATRTPSSPVSRSTTPEERAVDQRTTQKTYGGFAAITWKEYSKNVNNFALKTRYTKDLRPGLVDHVVEILKVADSLTTLPGMRALYEAMIIENTIDDEPDAPAIEIHNNVDDIAAPPWEFYYTNYMWHGEGVPAPDVKDLVGCSCRGGCSPKSKSCTCLKKQAAIYDENDFIYDKHGKLRKRDGYPIYECNALCGCGDECRNRVIQKGRKVHVHLRKTQYKGWGVFAGKKIPAGSFIGIYSGELISMHEAQRRGIAYNKFGRTYLFDLDFYYLRPAGPDAATWKPEFTVDAFKAGNFTRFLNHSCDPNTRLFPCYINEPQERPLLAVFATKDIEPNEEVCFSYTGDPGEDDSPKKIKADAIKLATKANKKDKIYEECKCGAANCSGYMFLYNSDDDDDDEGEE